jgi:hypothetical protein
MLRYAINFDDRNIDSPPQLLGLIQYLGLAATFPQTDTLSLRSPSLAIFPRDAFLFTLSHRTGIVKVTITDDE